MPIATRRAPPAPARPAPRAARPESPAPPSRPRSPPRRAYFLDVPYPLREYAMEAGATWNPTTKTWAYYGDGLPWELERYRGEIHSWERLREDEHNELPVVERPPEREIVLHQHQIEGGRSIYRAWKDGRKGFLVADDVGLGKTFTTWKAVRHMDVSSVLIVCPLAVVAHWRRSVRALGDGGKRVVVINYERLKKLFDVPEALSDKAKDKRKGRKVRTQKGVARYGSVRRFDVVIWDESHRLRNVETARAALARQVDAAARFRVWLSATAGQDPIELAYLAPLLAEATGARASSLSDYQAWCESQGIGVVKGAFGKLRWRGNSDDEAERAGADEDLERIRVMLFGGAKPAGIRRSPTDIAGWPEINRILLPVALDGEDRYLYEQAWGEFRDALELESSGRPNPTNALAIRTRFRQKASLLRTGFTVDHVQGLLDQGLSVAVSVAFHETLDVIKQSLEGAGHVVAVIHGQLHPREKERQRLLFQRDEARVCIFTVEEAISLHQGEYPEGRAPRAEVIHDVRWSGIQMVQIEGRTHRDGKSSPAYWMVGDGTVEEGIAKVVVRRIRTMGTMQGDAETIRELDRMLFEAGRSPRPRHGIG